MSSTSSATAPSWVPLSCPNGQSRVNASPTRDGHCINNTANNISTIISIIVPIGVLVFICLPCLYAFVILPCSFFDKAVLCGRYRRERYPVLSEESAHAVIPYNPWQTATQSAEAWRTARLQGLRERYGGARVDEENPPPAYREAGNNGVIPPIAPLRAGLDLADHEGITGSSTRPVAPQAIDLPRPAPASPVVQAQPSSETVTSREAVRTPPPSFASRAPSTMGPIAPLPASFSAPLTVDSPEGMALSYQPKLLLNQVESRERERAWELTASTSNSPGPPPSTFEQLCETIDYYILERSKKDPKFLKDIAKLRAQGAFTPEHLEMIKLYMGSNWRGPAYDGPSGSKGF